ncbi:MAG: glycolate oxidase subunit GlcE [Rhodospirillaceae bacterium]|nr:glycolate oxidase subunit GlcE [Rhodospirillaceae bacterium]
MGKLIKPRDAKETAEAIAWAAADKVALELIGAGTKRDLGRPVAADHVLDLSALAGVRDYEPAELVLTAGTGTKIAEIESMLTAANQELAFEPPDWGPIWGAEAGEATLGGIIACNLSGPRRIKAGAARDHLLGVAAVSGRGEIFKAGGRVVKNVTGYDLCKLLAGSYGTLAALTEVSVKVLPRPEKLRSVLVFGLNAEKAVAAMAAALNSPNDVSGAAYLPRPIAAVTGVARVVDPGTSVVALRVEGTEASALARNDALRELLGPFGPIEELHGMNSSRFWRGIRDATHFVAGENTIWRISVPPAEGARVALAIADSLEAYFYLDWGGGLIWLSAPERSDGGAKIIHAAIAGCGGHATLIRASAAVREAVPVFEPQAPALAALSRRVKEAFDPLHILNPGRMYADR